MPVVLLSLATLLVGLVELVVEPGSAAFGMSTLVLALSVVAVGGWRVAAFAGDEPLDVRLVDAALLGFAYMALAGLVLGTAGILAWWSLLLLTGLCGLLAGWFLRPGSPEAVPVRFDWPGLGVALSLALGAFAVVQAVGGRILRPPIGDPLAYHLPFAVEWLQRGSLAMPIPPAGDPSPPFYPLNSSLWIFWLLAPFESEILARFVQLPFLLILGLAVYRLARELRLPASAAALAGGLVVSVPEIARSASLAENDLIVAALLVTMTAFLARLYNGFTTWRALLVALALGLAVGVKVIALALGAVPGLVWLALVFGRNRPGGRRRVAALAVGGAVIVLMVGGYSYLRNAVVMENPLYPAGYRVAGWLLFDGLYFPTWEWRQNHAFFPFDWAALFTGGRRIFGLTVTAWALPGVALAGAALLAGLARGDWRDRRLVAPLVLLLWVPLSLAIFWFIIPYHFNRFLFPTLAWAVVAGMWGLAWWAQRLAPERAARWYPAPALPIIVYNLLNVPIDLTIRETPRYWLIALGVVGGVLLGIAALSGLRAERLPALARLTVVALGVMAIALFPIYDREFEARRYDEWRWQIAGFNQQTEAWEWLDRETAGAPATIAVAGTNEVYPLYGSGLDDRLLTIWHSGELAEYGWGASFTLYGAPDRAAWEAQVAEQGVDFVVVTENVSFGGWPVEREWLLDSAARFSRVFRNDDIEIWEVSESARLPGVILVGEGGSSNSMGIGLDQHC